MSHRLKTTFTRQNPTPGAGDSPRSALVRSSLARYIAEIRGAGQRHDALTRQYSRLGYLQFIEGGNVAAELLLLLSALHDSREALTAAYGDMTPPTCAPPDTRLTLTVVVENLRLVLDHEARAHSASRAVLELLVPFGGTMAGLAASMKGDSPEENARAVALYGELETHAGSAAKWIGLGTEALAQAVQGMQAVIGQYDLEPLLA